MSELTSAALTLGSISSEAVKKSPTKLKPKERKQSGKSSGNERLKAVVRRLPPNLPEEIFWQSVQPWVTDDAVLWKVYFPGKLRKKLNKENIHSRAYIAFKTEELLATFSRDYDGHVFRDKAGNESQAVVEFSPSQKIPLEKKKVDSRNATIEKDEEFIAFMQAFEQSMTKQYDAEQLLETLIASTERQPMPKSTPLLDALKAEKSAQKDKEAISRNHPHYKDSGSSSKKDDQKKKGGAGAPPAKPAGEQPATVGKRAAKKAAAAAAAAQKSVQQPPASQSKPLAPASPVSAAHIAAPASKSGRGGRLPPPAEAGSDTQRPKTPVVTLAPAVSAAAAAAASTSDASASAAPTQPGGRRARPVLGIASRQFEAALSGAGVAKSRRERHAEKDKDTTKEGRVAVSEEKKEGGKGKEREARRREERGQGSGSAPGAATSAVGSAQASAGMLPSPAILQREAKQQAPRIATRPADPDATPAASGVVHLPDGAIRGSGKTRGRGRGRGANRGG